MIELRNTVPTTEAPPPPAALKPLKKKNRYAVIKVAIMLSEKEAICHEGFCSWTTKNQVR
jgi:hypothetical protein